MLKIINVAMKNLTPFSLSRLRTRKKRSIYEIYSKKPPILLYLYGDKMNERVKDKPNRKRGISKLVYLRVNLPFFIDLPTTIAKQTIVSISKP